MNITLAQALPLRNSINRRIHELISERNQVAFVEVEKGGQYEKPTRTVEQVTEELNVTRSDFRALDVAMAAENLKAKVEWDGREVSLTEAIELSKQIRGEVNELKRFGQRKKQERQASWRTEEVTYVHAQFEPEEYRKSALKLERQVNKLSSEIERKNHFVEFDFVAAERYLA